MIYEPALALAERIGAELDGVWQVYLPRADIDHLATLERADGLCLSISRREGRGHCSPQERPPFGARHMPDMHGFGVLKSTEQRPHATFAPDRAPASIARDIQRKVLTPFEPLRVAYLARLNAKTDDRQAVADTSQKIAEMLGSTPGGFAGQLDPDRVYIGLGQRHHAYGRFEISTYMHGRVKVELNNLTLDDAEALAQWIAARNQPLGHDGG